MQGILLPPLAFIRYNSVTLRSPLMPTITLRDQSTAGHPTGPDLTLDFLTEHITVRELLRSRVYQEVQDFNLKLQQGDNPHFRGLVQPTAAEKLC
jgi:hypothetical protein